MSKTFKDQSTRKATNNKARKRAYFKWLKDMENRIYLSNISRELLEENLILARAYAEHRENLDYNY